MSHKCHAKGCDREVDPKFLMCWDHWRQVPLSLKAAVWRYYQKGQEVRKGPTPEYLAAARAAIDAVAAREGR